MTLSVGVDVGGTKIAAGVVTEDGSLIASTRRESPAEQPDAIADDIAAMVTELSAEHRIASVGVAAAGFIDLARTEVMFAPNLAWREEPLRTLIADRVAVPVAIENDANAAAWAEFRFGAGQGARTLLMVTIGTGIGGGLVLGGQVFRGGFGVAAEFGHMRVVPGGRRCACGLDGCWEAYGSGTGLSARARELAAADPSRAVVLLDLAGGDVEAIKGPMVSEAAESGDPVAKESFVDLARWIGQGLGSLAAVIDPDVIVVGGGVSESPELDLAVISESFERSETGFGHRPAPRIARAALGNDAGLIGAADLARLP
jgi:glucokinase